ncbi:TATA-binding protein-associated factor BTAF1 [Ipomoea triloba]|uniref:TATA-binding protein-associated factor BTAF1 n=1 Tax=Ipomoea triloba TaxID=35885 RepID=UPI00125D5D1E|nr:TATA-binding protein-associated factor BTAF1 [Ipomoea triloba]XP_031131068.1 TATA-binding protein-associated factor BTAF1 [Ipomoea triloba]
MAQQQSSRLNRLLTLLDTGSTQATRLTAAKQIGEIAKSHPQDLNSLLSKVSQYLRSKKWDTRVAAAHAIGAIAENVKHTSLTDLCDSVEKKMIESGVSGSVEDLVAWDKCNPKLAGSTSFGSFDLNKVLEFGALLASGGQEYDLPADNSKNPKERLARQKQNLRRRLGLDVCEQFMDVNEMIRDEDLVMQRVNSPVTSVSSHYYSPRPQGNIRHFVANMVPSAKSRRPSARELNLLKRKAKVSSKDQTKGWSKDGEPDAPQPQDMTSPRGIQSDASGSNKMHLDTVSDEDGLESDADGCWPFQCFVEQLMVDMFDPLWEIRHGSVMALREILTHQGANAGAIMPDRSGDVGLGSILKDRVVEKQESVIDLNIQVPLDESEPAFKKPKIEDASPLVMDTIPSASMVGNIDNIQVKVEDVGLNLPVRQENGEVNVGSVKMEIQSNSNSESSFNNYMVEAKSSCEDNISLEKMDLPRNLPENCELMNLVKLARHSWLKNSEFLQDCAIRFLCILSLDRFGDYVSDQVVAPVRETCAQALGAVLKYMHPTLVYETLSILLQMQHRPEWEIRHGSLLGIKYLVAVRKEMLHDLLCYVLPACKSGLEDADDDVRAVSADALIPTAADIVSLKSEILHSIVMLLWDILLDLDDLSPSTSSVMNLLAEIYSQERMIPNGYGNLPSLEKQDLNLNEVVYQNDIGEGLSSLENPHMLSTLAPRLWPFMRHSITSVRYAAIRTLERLLEAGRKRSLCEASGSFWPSFILGDTLRIVFQNLLLESNEEILQCSGRVWRLLLQCPVNDLTDAAKAYFSFWIELSTTPYGSPLDTTKMFWPVALPRKSHFKAAAKMRAVKPEGDPYKNICFGSAEGTSLQEKNGDTSTHIGKIIVGGDVDISVTQTRVVTATALGVLASKLDDSSLQYVVDPLWNALASFSGVQRQVSSMLLVSWFKELKFKDISKSEGVITCISSNFGERLLDLLACTNPAFPSKDSALPYAELSRTYEKMRNEARQLYHGTEASGMFKDILSSSMLDLESLSADDAVNFASKLSFLNNITTGEESAGRSIFDELESLKQRVLTTAGYLKCVQNNLHVTVSALLAAAVVWMSNLPAKLNPIILPLMASIKREQEEILQSKAAEALAELIYCCMGRKPGPNDKLIKNLCSLTCMDPCETPQAGVLNSIEKIEEQGLLSFRSSNNRQKSKVHMLSPGDDRSKVEGFISRRGAELALKCLCEKFGGSLFDKLPKLWDCLVEVLKPGNVERLNPEDEKLISEAIDSVTDPQILINNIQVVRSIAPLLDETLRSKLLTLLPCIFRCVCHPHVAVRLAASRCITTLAKSMAVNVMSAVVENVVPMLGDMTSVHSRQGAGMLVNLLVQGLGVELVPYAPLLVVPLLRCMSDSDHSVRQSVTHSFATLVPLLPLARGVSPPAGLSDRLSRNQEDVKFLEQLVDNSHIDDYKLSTELKVTLRRYQQEGINWLAFLKRFNLHGILCDDMGLGKTLQSSAIVASDIAEHVAANTAENLPPSLIICPSTLVGHWEYEIEKFIDASLVTTLQYVGSAQERTSLRSQFNRYSVIVTSYDVVRKDVDSLRQVFWNYCILDEGHIIKNAKSKVTLAVKQLKAQHRLILSGTPIQNNVLDLWSLFDFLMPGFLGTERQFHASYGKPLIAARDPKCSAKDAEAGALAMEALHKQVMPFLLRRTKEEVLSDLPEKIIQDRYCDLSPVQLKLYEQFSGSDVKQEISSMVKVNESDTGQGSEAPKASTHVFQALQYLLKLCSHPLLVLGEKISESVSSVLSAFLPNGSNIVSELHKPHHSPKLVALQEILEECGIGIDASGSDSPVNVGQHRVLIFAQHKAFLDIIEKDLFHSQMKNVTYLRLDGSVEPDKRFEIVKAFNSDPTIDVLLLTTHVGGLGLNLTSADTLVFMEHDWNPMRDHQAMDRAHRLGQKKVVHVHRLIMRGTLEEKVMSLQRFKVSVANAVINSENASLKTMNTDQLLDLFTPADGKKAPNVSQSSDDKFEGDPKLTRGGKGLKAILGGLEELWDQSQYSEEYNLSHFLAKLNG